MSSPYICQTLPITLAQAQEIIDERANGSFDINSKGIASPSGEWCLAELEAFVIRRRYEEKRPFVYWHLPIGRDGVHLQQEPIFGYTKSLAAECVAQFQKEKESGKPRVDGLSPSKGGRVWLDGCWEISQLEAVCAWLRYLTGDAADGAVETLAGALRDSEDSWTQHRENNPHFEPPLSIEQIKQMLYAGINPEVYPRVWHSFLDHAMSGHKLPRIVCAANEVQYIDGTGQIQKLVIPGARHCDELMGKISQALQTKYSTIPGHVPHIVEDQGFVDIFGTYWTREEAWVIAEFNCQIGQRQSWLAGRLYSENLY
jgi:hypothetical protein